MHRRHFITSAVSAAVATQLPRGFAAGSGRAPRILLRNGWQSVNIGDIGHTPGALALLYKYIPDAEITLWPGEIGHGAREMLQQGYPKLKIVEGSVGSDGKPTKPELAQAWADADLYLSGSGSGFPAASHAIAFQKATGKPVGVFAVSTDPISGFGNGRDPQGGTLMSIRERAMKLPPTHLSTELRYIMDRASFFFCRDSISRDYLKAQGVKSPIVEFGPDSQLGMTLRDDAKGFAYLKAQGLAEGKFICVIPRLRYTPYWSHAGRKPGPDDPQKEAINQRTTKQDHDKLREMIALYVRNTGHKVLACAEMTYEIKMAKDELVDPLPADVKKNIVWRDSYWLPDEAASVYSKAQAVVSVECHSPLIALHNGTPTFYVRQPTDTCKGQMYRDIGANDWFFEIDETNGQQLWSRLEAIHKDPAAARAKVKTIMAGVEKLQRRMVDAVRAAATRA
jgi:polysaccharide pyruvyl transferase WcaK-like protein